jgi:hypothetical protein
VLAGKYVVEGLLGSGWEGEVYRVTERSTGIKRAMKLFSQSGTSRARWFASTLRNFTVSVIGP